MKPTGAAFLNIHRQFYLVFLCVFIPAILMAACGPKKKYAGPYLPDEKIAVVKPGDKVFTHVNILSVDKNPLYTDELSISVQPGPHVFFIEAYLDYPFLDSDLYFNQYLAFEAEAGKTYTIDATILPMEKKGFSWVADEDDPETVIVKKYALDILPLPDSD